MELDFSRDAGQLLCIIPYCGLFPVARLTDNSCDTALCQVDISLETELINNGNNEDRNLCARGSEVFNSAGKFVTLVLFTVSL